MHDNNPISIRIPAQTRERIARLAHSINWQFAETLVHCLNAGLAATHGENTKDYAALIETLKRLQLAEGNTPATQPGRTSTRSTSSAEQPKRPQTNPKKTPRKTPKTPKTKKVEPIATD